MLRYMIEDIILFTAAAITAQVQKQETNCRLERLGSLYILTIK